MDNYRSINFDGQNSLLSKVWEQQVLQNNVPEEGYCFSIAKRSLQFVSAATGVGARIPAINVARKFGGDNQAYGWSLAVINVISYGSLIAWGFVKMLNAEMKVVSEDEKLLKAKSKSNIPLPGKVAIATIGIFSQTPFAYMAYQYNEKNIGMAVFILVADASLPIYSLNLSTSALIKKRQLSNLTTAAKDIQEIKLLLVNFLEKHRKTLPKIYKQGTILLNLNRSLVLESETSTLLENKNVKVQTGKDPVYLSILRNTLKATGYLITLARLTAYSAMSYKGAELLLSGSYWEEHDKFKQGLSIGTAGLVFLANAYLMKDVVVNSINNRFQAIVDRIRGTSTENLATVFRPKLRSFLSFLTFGLSAMSYSTPLQLAKDLFENEYDINGFKILGVRTIIEVGSTMAVFLLVSNSLNAFVDEIVEMSISKFGSQEHKDLISLDSRLKRFINSIENSSLVDFAKFVYDLQQKELGRNNISGITTENFPLFLDEELTTWSKNLKISSQKLTEFIESIESSV